MIRNHKVTNLINKDLLEIKNDKAAIASLLVVPSIFSVFLPLIILLGGTSSLPTNSIGGISVFLERLPKEMVLQQGLNQEKSAAYAVLMYFFKPLFLLIPVIISTVISSSSFVGEKENKTVEGLLYTPLTNKELMLGKILASAIPSMIITWLSMIVYGVILDTFGFYVFGEMIFPDINWLIIGLILDPLIVFLAISLIITVSQRVKTSKSAQSVAVVMVLPIMGLIISQAGGVMLFGIKITLLLSLVLIIIDIVIFLIISKKFNREKFIMRI